MNNDGHEVFLRRLGSKHVELNKQSCMRLGGASLFRSIQSLRLIEGIRDIQMSSNIYIFLNYVLIED